MFSKKNRILCYAFTLLPALIGLVLWVTGPRTAFPAAILFTSGSSAAPKGVPLSHDNILANCRDVAAILALDSHDAMLAMLPPFHTLGLTGNIVLPLCFGVPVVFHANPTEGARLDAVCRRWRPTLLVAAPTFLDGMLRQARPGDLASLRVAFVGAEACPQRLYDDFARLSGGGLLCEGYGVTECSPVISLNLPTDARTGTIGQPLPSVRTAIVSVQEPRQPCCWCGAPMCSAAIWGRAATAARPRPSCIWTARTGTAPAIWCGRTATGI